MTTFLLLYYLPIYFQAIKNSSPSESGVQNLPLILAMCETYPLPTRAPLLGATEQ